MPFMCMFTFSRISFIFIFKGVCSLLAAWTGAVLLIRGYWYPGMHSGDVPYLEEISLLWYWDKQEKSENIELKGAFFPTAHIRIGPIALK